MGIGVLAGLVLGCGGEATSGEQDAAPADVIADGDLPRDTAPSDTATGKDAGQRDATPPCYAEPDESLGGDRCDDAVDKGELEDTASGHLTLRGNIYPEGDQDWYQVTFVDLPDDASACDPFNARIAFTQNPDDKYRFEVFLGDCTSAPTCADGETNRGLTEFDYNDAAECPCVEVTADPPPTSDGVHACVDHTMTLMIRVYRETGAVACENYELSVDNG